MYIYSGAHRIADYPIKRITHNFRTDDLSWCSAVTSNHGARGVGRRRRSIRLSVRHFCLVCCLVFFPALHIYNLCSVVVFCLRCDFRNNDPFYCFRFLMLLFIVFFYCLYCLFFQKVRRSIRSSVCININAASLFIIA